MPQHHRVSLCQRCALSGVGKVAVGNWRGRRKILLRPQASANSIAPPSRPEVYGVSEKLLFSNFQFLFRNAGLVRDYHAQVSGLLWEVVFGNFQWLFENPRTSWGINIFRGVSPTRAKLNGSTFSHIFCSFFIVLQICRISSKYVAFFRTLFVSFSNMWYFF